MAIVNKNGQVMANLSQTIKVFTTKQDFDIFVNRLPSVEALDAFCVFKCWERPFLMLAEGKTVALAEAQKNFGIGTFTVGESYEVGDIVTNEAGDRILRCLMAIEEAAIGDDLTKFEVIADEYAFARPAVNGYLPVAGDIMSEVGADGALRFYLIKKTLDNPISDTNTLAGQTGEFVVDLQGEHVPAIPDFVPGHKYEKDEVAAYEGMLYRAKEAFNAGDTFDADKFELISSVTHAIEDFEANTHYAKHELVLHNNQLYAAREDFTSGAEFNEDDWIAIGQVDHIFEYDATEGYPARSIVVDGNDVYMVLKSAPAGTPLTNAEYFRLLSFTPKSMTQAEWDAMETKPVMALITDSIYDMTI